MRGLHRMISEAQLDQFFVLWQHIQHVELTQEKDTVVWNLTTNGQYSAKSAYITPISLEDYNNQT